jgi:hypothetical protein
MTHLPERELTMGVGIINEAREKEHRELNRAYRMRGRRSREILSGALEEL